MTDINAEIGARLQRLRLKNNMTKAHLAEQVGVDPSTVSRHESGKRAINTPEMVRYASVLNVDPAALLSDDKSLADSLASNATFMPSADIQTIPIVGTVQAGAWLEAEEADPETYAYTAFANDKVHTGVDAFALVVAGNSMDLVMPEGALLRCVALSDYRKGSLVSRYVIVDRTKPDGTVESTVKQLMQDGPDFILQPRSTDPRHKPIRLSNTQAQPVFNGGFVPHEEGDRQDQIAIRAVVTGISHEI